jgi:cytochrome b6-f complex iron-sulfur subunit
MAQKKTEHSTKPQNNQRRSFLLKAWLGLGILAFAEIVWVALSFLRPRPAAAPAKGIEAILTAGRVDEFELNSVTAFPQGHFYLVRLEDGGFLALSRRCTHLGCTLPWVAEANRFVCPCHSSSFDIRGDVIQSPAPRALDLLTVLIENQVVRVDTGRILRRSGFRREQVVYDATS